VRRVPLRRAWAPVEGFHAHQAHQPGHALPANGEARQAQQIAQHAATCEREIQVQLVDQPHQHQIGRRRRLMHVVHGRAVQLQNLALPPSP
jgi:hypothetical protein